MNKFEAERRFIQRMKDNYPPGTRIMLLQMGDDPRPIEPNTKGTIAVVDDIEKVYLCLDNDVPGQEAAERLSQKLMTHGVSHEILIPTRKDWNEDRQAACANAPHKSAEFFISKNQEEEPCPTLQL